jgi:hypothetical protein
MQTRSPDGARAKSGSGGDVRKRRFDTKRTPDFTSFNPGYEPRHASLLNLMSYVGATARGDFVMSTAGHCCDTAGKASSLPVMWSTVTA